MTEVLLKMDGPRSKAAVRELLDSPELNEGREGGRYRLELNQEVRAAVGGGGPDMTFKTWNGDIFIRRGGG